ncbi:hypothetical protein B566_EDAN011261, partial [Ephemera danica]
MVPHFCICHVYSGGKKIIIIVMSVSCLKLVWLFVLDCSQRTSTAAEMKRNHNPSPDEDRSKETDNIDITEPSTSTATYVSSLPSTSRDSYGTPEQSTSSVSNRESQESARKSSRDSKFKYLMEPKKTGGGGKDSGHGFAFHLDVTKLMLFELRELCNSDPEFQFKIWLEKAGYGKFDDIVLRYKKSDKWVEICIQCKHGEEKIGDDGTKTILKTKNLVEVLKFSTEEALQYLDATSIECNEVAKRELAEIYQCWPLALCLAASYIKLRTGESFGQISCSD